MEPIIQIQVDQIHSHYYLLISILFCLLGFTGFLIPIDKPRHKYMIISAIASLFLPIGSFFLYQVYDYSRNADQKISELMVNRTTQTVEISQRKSLLKWKSEFSDFAYLLLLPGQKNDSSTTKKTRTLFEKLTYSPSLYLVHKSGYSLKLKDSLLFSDYKHVPEPQDLKSFFNLPLYGLGFKSLDFKNKNVQKSTEPIPKLELRSDYPYHDHLLKDIERQKDKEWIWKSYKLNNILLAFWILIWVFATIILFCFDHYFLYQSFKFFNVVKFLLISIVASFFIWVGIHAAKKEFSFHHLCIEDEKIYYKAYLENPKEPFEQSSIPISQIKSKTCSEESLHFSSMHLEKHLYGQDPANWKDLFEDTSQIIQEAMHSKHLVVPLTHLKLLERIALCEVFYRKEVEKRDTLHKEN
jgi:hypothetical protein